MDSFEFFHLLEAAGIITAAENVTEVHISAEAGREVRINVSMLAPEGIVGVVTELARRAA